MSQVHRPVLEEDITRQKYINNSRYKIVKVVRNLNNIDIRQDLKNLCKNLKCMVSTSTAPVAG